TSSEPYPHLAGHVRFSDMPADVRSAFEREATVTRLQTDEEVSGFGLALVMDGELGVLPLIAETAAAALGAFDVMRSRGTIDESVGLRLVCMTPEATVATWSEAQVAQALGALPWVEEELREAADRVHAQIAVTLGPFGETLDASLLHDLFAQLDVRVLLPDEVLLEPGSPHPGLLIAGVGDLVVVDADGQSVTFDPGAVVFPGELLTGGQAPALVRAGQRGATVLQANRAQTDELLIVFPPVLELLTKLVG
ncbi:MAG: hypothetical protein MUF54_23605, partial [Polyangiaceae bacterium]|nr:hypothetical protein [Polyangiaceae bacterium]